MIDIKFFITELREVYLGDTMLVEIVLDIEDGFIDLRLLVSHFF